MHVVMIMLSFRNCTLAALAACRLLLLLRIFIHYFFSPFFTAGLDIRIHEEERSTWLVKTFVVVRMIVGFCNLSLVHDNYICCCLEMGTETTEIIQNAIGMSGREKCPLDYEGNSCRPRSAASSWSICLSVCLSSSIAAPPALLGLYNCPHRSSSSSRTFSSPFGVKAAFVRIA